MHKLMYSNSFKKCCATEVSTPRAKHETAGSHLYFVYVCFDFKRIRNNKLLAHMLLGIIAISKMPCHQCRTFPLRFRLNLLRSYPMLDWHYLCDQTKKVFRLMFHGFAIGFIWSFSNDLFAKSASPSSLENSICDSTVSSF